MPYSPSGFSFMTPMALWALLTLGIPVLIHLFNRSRGKLVRIGHIDLIRKARRLQVTEIKLAQWILLLLRVAIFLLAALILAGLARPGLEGSKSPTAYVTPTWLKTAQASQVEDLLTSENHQPGARYMVLQPDFRELTSAVADEIRQTPANTPDISRTWPLLAERLSLEHHDGPVDVYATDLMLEYGASRPDLPRQVSWHLLSPKTGISVGNLPASVIIGIDTEHRQDAGVIVAALNSLKAQRIPGLSWEMVAAGQLSAQQLNADWLILLSEAGLNEAQLALISTTGTILTDGSGKPQQDNSRLVRTPFYPFSSFRVTGLTAAPPSGQTLLSTADGRPVIQVSQYGPARLLQFNSRFNPAWSSIAQQAEFPELLLQLMLGRHADQLTFIDVRVNPDRLHTNGTQTAIDVPLPRRSLQSLLATLLALLWMTERWLSERKKRAVV